MNCVHLLNISPSGMGKLNELDPCVSDITTKRVLPGIFGKSPSTASVINIRCIKEGVKKKEINKMKRAMVQLFSSPPRTELYHKNTTLCLLLPYYSSEKVTAPNPCLPPPWQQPPPPQTALTITQTYRPSRAYWIVGQRRQYVFTTFTSLCAIVCTWRKCLIFTWMCSTTNSCGGVTSGLCGGQVTSQKRILPKAISHLVSWVDYPTSVLPFLTRKEHPHRWLPHRNIPTTTTNRTCSSSNGCRKTF